MSFSAFQSTKKSVGYFYRNILSLITLWGGYVIVITLLDMLLNYFDLVLFVFEQESNKVNDNQSLASTFKGVGVVYLIGLIGLWFAKVWWQKIIVYEGVQQTTFKPLFLHYFKFSTPFFIFLVSIMLAEYFGSEIFTAIFMIAIVLWFGWQFFQVLKLPISSVAKVNSLWDEIRFLSKLNSLEILFFSGFGSLLASALFIFPLGFLEILFTLKMDDSDWVSTIFYSAKRSGWGFMFATILAGFVCDLHPKFSLRGTVIVQNTDRTDKLEYGPDRS